MNDHRATTPDRGRARHAAGDGPRPYAPGSRLRRALDIARGSADPEELPSDRNDAQAEGGPAASGDIATTSTPSRRGLGRDLDAVPDAVAIPADEPETWETAAQGWVRTEDGSLEWRPIVTTVQRLESWEVATYVGIVTGRASATPPEIDASTPSSVRREALRRMVEEATARGAHGVVGVSLQHTDEPGSFVVTAVGTAVTLAHRR